MSPTPSRTRRRPTPSAGGQPAEAGPASARAARLAEILAAAAEVMGDKCYERTQMSDVARALGVSAGNLYNYVESKEALFHLLVEHGFGRVTPPSLPDGLVRTPAAGETMTLLRRRLAEEVVLPTLDGALGRRGAPRDPRAEAEAVVRELYGVIARNRRAIRILERSAHEWPELAALFYADVRRAMLEKLQRWIASRVAQGAFAPAGDAAVAARFVNETIAWFAMHRFGDFDARQFDDRACEETVVTLLVRALQGA